MKKKIAILFSLLLTVVFALQGVTVYASQVKQEMEKKKSNDGKIKIVCMIFPQYDWLRQVIGEEIDNYDIRLLLDNGSELHSYQPTVEDMAEISSCDFFFYVGGESDMWVLDALKSAKNPNLKAVSLLDMLEDYAKVEEEIEGAMEHKHSHEVHESEEHHEEIDSQNIQEGYAYESHEHSDHEEEQQHKEHEHEAGYDEHLWLSIRNAKIAVEKISQIVCELDTKNAAVYRANSEQYEKKLQKLDLQYETMTDNAKRKTILFGDRFPFRYLADDYGFNYYAAFEGCSAETGVSFETIIFLANKIDEENLPAIFTLENANQQLARVITENTKEGNQSVLTLHSMQSVTKSQIEQEGLSYIGLMEDNLDVLSQALN